MRKLLVVALAILLSACGGNYVETEVRTLQAIQGSVSGKSFMMVPDRKQQGSLEWKHYSDMVAAKLEAAGMRRAAAGPSSDYAVFIKYVQTDGETSVHSTPIVGQTGGGTTATTSGYIGRTPVYGSTYTPPTFGVVGMSTSQTTTYGRALNIEIVDLNQSRSTGKLASIYDATGFSHGASGNLMAVMPYIIEAMFVGWPAPNGSSIKRQVAVK